MVFRGQVGRRVAQHVFVVTEIAVALVLLVTAGLLVRSLAHLWQGDPGFEPRDVVTFYTGLAPEHMTSPSQVRAALVAIEDHLAAIPGVTRVSLDVGALPFSGGTTSLGFQRAEAPPPTEDRLQSVALFYAVGTRYFATMGIPLRHGRVFAPEDDARAVPVLLVDDALAQAVYPHENPVGKRIRIAYFEQDFEIIGVVGHVKHHGLADDDVAQVRSQLYVPHRQLPAQIAAIAGGAVTVLLKSSLPTARLMPSVRTTLHAFASARP